MKIFLKFLLVIHCLVNTHLYAAEAEPVSTQTLWTAYLARYLQADGRVLDSGIGQDTTSSEAQVYTLLLSLIANDRSTFDTVLGWTETHMAQNDLTQHLPGWSWGKRQDGTWILLDSNPASDADLWLAYTLFQAGNLWKEPRYSKLAEAILLQVKQTEIKQLPGFGAMLLPAPVGFHQQNTWRFNPSYLPLQVIQYFKKIDRTGPWAELHHNTLKLFDTFPRDVAPDWVMFDEKTGWSYDESVWPVGSYDAIRTYMWTGMLHKNDPAKIKLLKSLEGMRHVVNITQLPPHKINIVNGDLETGAPVGFSAAMLPFLKSLDEGRLIARQHRAIKESLRNDLLGDNPRYYDQVLTLFGLGWEQGSFSFALDGSLVPRWHQ